MKKFSLFFLFFLVFSPFCQGFDLLEEEKSFLIDTQKQIKYEFEKREKKYLQEIEFLEKNIDEIKKNINEESLFPDSNQKSDFEKKVKEIENLAGEIWFPFIKEKSFKNKILSFFYFASKINKFEYDSKDIIMNGYLSGIYKDGERFGYVKINNRGFVFIDEKYNGKKIKNIFENKSNVFPLCFGKGIKMETGFLESVFIYLEKGGIMIYPIVLTGFAGFLLSAFQFFILFYQKVSNEKKDNQFFENLENDFKRYPSLKFVKKLNEKKEKGFLSLEIIDSLVDREIKKLEKFNPTIGVLAGIAPLIGLLGTVTGMIMTFNAAGGTGAVKAAEMAGGISEALVTTQLGLSIALPLMIFHHFFEQRIEKFVFDIEEKKSMFLLKESLK
ncbi:MAG: MotA/TolQ/ExbB proton channel family protein [Desulforegulaceae bacterium]|nr:MotA/TolQ/ExbB proton channel family protein [Desulforegulaceae bacterium]